MFLITSTDGLARRGALTLAHGKVNTPCFMPIATQGAIKGGIEASETEKLGFEMILSNTYHLHIRPTETLIQDQGGLHSFMQYNKPILTDSGGYQVFSLSGLRKIKEEGVYFQSHLDGAKLFLSPEKVVEINTKLGIDISMVLDECPPAHADKAYILQSVDRTSRWAARARETWQANEGLKNSMKIFGIVQGGKFQDLRMRSLSQLTELDLPGYAIGGLAIGEATEEMYEVLSYTTPALPQEKPRYLMGVGTPLNIIEAVSYGVDMFDCVLPTRNARHGKVFTSAGEFNISRKTFAEDSTPIDEHCSCPVCTKYSRSYIRHLCMSNEILAMRLATIHNLAFYSTLMKEIRTSIEHKNFLSWKAEFIGRYTQGA